MAKQKKNHSLEFQISKLHRQDELETLIQVSLCAHNWRHAKIFFIAQFHLFTYS